MSSLLGHKKYVEPGRYLFYLTALCFSHLQWTSFSLVLFRSYIYILLKFLCWAHFFFFFFFPHIRMSTYLCILIYFFLWILPVPYITVTYIQKSHVKAAAVPPADNSPPLSHPNKNRFTVHNPPFYSLYSLRIFARDTMIQGRKKKSVIKKGGPEDRSEPYCQCGISSLEGACIRSLF